MEGTVTENSPTSDSIDCSDEESSPSSSSDYACGSTLSLVDLPDDVLPSIFFLLDIKSFVRLSSTCRSLRRFFGEAATSNVDSRISEPRFQDFLQYICRKKFLKRLSHLKVRCPASQVPAIFPLEVHINQPMPWLSSLDLSYNRWITVPILAVIARNAPHLRSLKLTHCGLAWKRKRAYGDGSTVSSLMSDWFVREFFPALKVLDLSANLVVCQQSCYAADLERLTCERMPRSVFGETLARCCETVKSLFVQSYTRGGCRDPPLSPALDPADAAVLQLEQNANAPQGNVGNPHVGHNFEDYLDSDAYSSDDDLEEFQGGMPAHHLQNQNLQPPLFLDLPKTVAWYFAQATTKSLGVRDHFASLARCGNLEEVNVDVTHPLCGFVIPRLAFLQNLTHLHLRCSTSYSFALHNRQRQPLGEIVSYLFDHARFRLRRFKLDIRGGGRLDFSGAFVSVVNSQFGSLEVFSFLAGQQPGPMLQELRKVSKMRKLRAFRIVVGKAKCNFLRDFFPKDMPNLRIIALKCSNKYDQESLAAFKARFKHTRVFLQSRGHDGTLYTCGHGSPVSGCQECLDFLRCMDAECCIFGWTFGYGRGMH